MKRNIFIRIYHFYYEGFRNMNLWGRQVWIIIIVKVLIIFAVLKIFFFPDFLKTEFNTDKERSEYVLEQLTK